MRLGSGEMPAAGVRLGSGEMSAAGVMLGSGEMPAAGVRLGSCLALVSMLVFVAGCSTGTEPGSGGPSVPDAAPVSEPAPPEPVEAEPAPPEPGEAVPVSGGKSVYLRRCVGCHALDGSGIVGPDIRPGNIQVKYSSAAEMTGLIRDGAGEMPEFGSKLTDAEITAVANYVWAGLG
ncbi:c-type cytochrome [Candidatus Poriferisocius sp.]|uniref:c-type cytochrome n=1 Tax=Candidatus Poriferisocius sp. TaxID=3101276 RepID=UPI003B0143B7